MDRAFDSMRRSMESMMGELDAGRGALGGRTTSGTAVDDATNFTMDRVEGGYVVLADVPGFERDELEITVQNGEMTVSGERVTDEETAGRSTHRRRSVRRTVSIPESVSVDDISASYHNGVLEIELPADEDGDGATQIRID